MKLEDIIKLLRQYPSPFTFAETAETELVHYVKKKISREQQLIVEQELQKELTSAVKKHNNLSRKKSRQAYPDYKRDYYARFHKSAVVIQKETLFSAVNTADVIYVADFHPLKAPKESLIEIAEKTEGKITIALESVQNTKQPNLNRVARGHKIPFPFDKTWYKAQELYAQIIVYAQNNQHKINLAAIGTEHEDNGDFTTTDEQMAYLIASYVQKNEKTIVFAGDYHLAPNHLPAHVRELTQKKNQVIIYQNNTPLYWHLSEKHTKCPETVMLSQNEYCIFNTTPLIKYQSALDEFEEEDTTPEQKVAKLLATTYLLLLLNDKNIEKSLQET